jgi:hypothetical protein
MNRQRERLSNRCHNSGEDGDQTVGTSFRQPDLRQVRGSFDLQDLADQYHAQLNEQFGSPQSQTDAHHPTVSPDRHWLRRPSHRVPRLLLMRVPCLSQAWGPGRFLALPRRRCRVLRQPPRLYCRRRCLDRRNERMKLGASQAGLDVLGLLNSAHR